MSLASQPSKYRRVGSAPTIGPDPVEVLEGAVNSRRHHLRSWLLFMIALARLPGSGPYPGDHRGTVIVRVGKGVKRHQELQFNVDSQRLGAGFQKRWFPRPVHSIPQP
jgi:hypothetical protein